ncbi:MAG: PEP-utilizing enzyme [Methanomassiliicoccales archaeon]
MRLVGGRPGQREASGRASIDELDVEPNRREGALDYHEKAVQGRLLKEQVGITFALGLSLHRRCFASLGERMVGNGVLADASDVYMLTLDEVRQIAEGGCSTNTCNNYRLRAFMRKKEMAEVGERGSLPVIFGEKEPPGFSYPGKDMIGAPGAGGYCLGPARSLSSGSDIKDLQRGEISVIPDTSIEWVAILETAAGVVSSGGSMFSDLMFLAREKGVPAAVRVDGASGLKDGVRLSVDGYRGVVRIVAQEGSLQLAGIPDLSRQARS